MSKYTLNYTGSEINNLLDKANASASIQYVEQALSTGLCAGMILMWSGSIDAVPQGWALCDGTNGTPNLIDRFIVGAGSKYQIGDIGGSDSVTLQTSQIPEHSHTIGGSTGSVQNGDSSSKSFITKFSSGNNETSTVGGGKAHENRPPYYALAYIIKL